MAPMLRCRIHNELLDRAVQTRVRIGILAGHGGGESHDSLAVDRDEDAERCLRRSLDCGTPRVGHLHQ